jgi:hypothetical protein
LLSASRLVSTFRTWAIARITLAVMLTFVLLAGVVPLSSFSASSHECGMACCAGKPSHMAGACSVAFSTEEEAEAPPAPDEEHSAHNHSQHSTGATSETTASVQQHGAAKASPAQHSTSRVTSPPAASVASQAMTTPCSPECAAAATLSSSQGRRPRELASLTVSLRPRPPTRGLFKGHFTVPARKSAEARRRLRPRAPPFSLNNLSA